MKVVITGVGAYCALGENTEMLWKAIEKGQSGIAPINHFNVDAFDIQLGAVISSSSACDTDVQTAVAYGRAAAAEALENAGIVDPSRVALVLGTCNGLGRKEIHAISVDLVNFLKLGGPSITVSTACASSTHAIGLAVDMVRRGVVEYVLTGGVDQLYPEIFAGFHSLGLLSKTPCAPFSTVIGTTLGEGAAFLLLESESSANARDVVPLAECMGYGFSADAFHDTTPDPSGFGIASALSTAVADAGLIPESIDYLNAHGTGTAPNDAAEWRGIQSVFGDYAGQLPVSSSKSFLGHAQGAAGALEAVVTLLAMTHSVVPPTLNFTEPRPNSPTDPVASGKPRAHVTQHTVCANAAFGGLNAAVVFGQPNGELVPRRKLPRPIGLIGASMVKDCHQIHQYVPRSELRGLDPTARFLASAVANTLTDARLRLRSLDCEGIGLFVGQNRPSVESLQAFQKSVEARGFAQPSASAFTRMACSYATGACCRLFGLKGPATTLSTGPDSGLTALVLAADHLAWRDDVSALLAAAVDEPCEWDDFDYDHGAASVLLKAGASDAPIHLVSWALATDCESAVERALAKISRNREEVVPIVVPGPPTVTGLWAVTAAVNALKQGEQGPFLISNRADGAAGAAIILQMENRHAI